MQSRLVSDARSHLSRVNLVPVTQSHLCRCTEELLTSGPLAAAIGLVGYCELAYIFQHVSVGILHDGINLLIPVEDSAADYLRIASADQPQLVSPPGWKRGQMKSVKHRLGPGLHHDMSRSTGPVHGSLVSIKLQVWSREERDQLRILLNPPLLIVDDAAEFLVFGLQLPDSGGRRLALASLAVGCQLPVVLSALIPLLRLVGACLRRRGAGLELPGLRFQLCRARLRLLRRLRIGRALRLRPGQRGLQTRNLDRTRGALSQLRLLRGECLVQFSDLGAQIPIFLLQALVARRNRWGPRDCFGNGLNGEGRTMQFPSDPHSQS